MKLNTIIVIAIAILSTTLLIGRLFNVTWSGGEGYVQQGVAIADGVQYKRGETIETEEDQWLKVELPGTTVWMYENTQLKLINLVDQYVELTVLQGRVVIDGQAIMRIRDQVTPLDGLYSYVYYSWLDQVDLQAIHEGFDYSQSEAKEFYDWVLN